MGVLGEDGERQKVLMPLPTELEVAVVGHSINMPPLTGLDAG